MPTWTEERLNSAIDEKEIGFITLDTNIFDQYGCNLDYSVFSGLDQFRDTHVSVVFSDIIAGEVQAHIAKDASEKAAALQIALNQYRKAWRRPEDGPALAPLVDLEQSSTDFAKGQWDAFIDAIGAEILEAEGRVSFNELLECYFAPHAPFAGKGDKKSEFPDAIALLALEDRARRAKRTLLAVSADGDWQRFAETSDHIVVVGNLPKALKQFNPGGRLHVQRLVAQLLRGKAPELSALIDSEIDSWLDECDFTPDGESEFLLDAMPNSAVREGWEVVGEPATLWFDKDELVFSLDIDCSITFSADFDLQILDSVDKDYVSMGSTAASVTETRRINLTILCAATEEERYEPYDSEVARRHIHVDFGRIEPDWWDD
ncbi:PIN domain-containing protein [Sphingopyxis sp. JAI108]|uniref:PIN domain-containing protein n=1 Tax=Sphingopyxis sp. JAI108 TaxID=2723060 RepID=UPI0015CCBC58|nr:PIN domain-containing protein [Sphingopyxis sp. JAI108]NYF33816.1 hypothetical protein [Sphingopyxis sp. JAI108]